MRPLALAVAAVFMVFAAYGLSPALATDDYCVEDTLRIEFWPHGIRCEYAPGPERGTGPVEPDTASVPGFFAALVVGLAFVLLRRSKLALGTALMFGIAGLAATLVGPVPLLFFGWVFGGLAAYFATRSVAATVLPAAALFVAYLVQFFDDVPLAWAAVLLVLMLLPQRADVPRTVAVSH